jgi:tetratricopeptide (TPR) repeat protein
MVTFAEAVELEKAGKYHEAYALFQQLSQASPPSGEVWVHMAALQLLWNRPQEALMAYEQAIRLDAGNPYAWEGKARGLWRVGHKQEALPAVDQALARNPQFVSALSLKGQILAEFNDERSLQWAVACSDQALALNPSSMEALIAKAKALVLLRRWNEAFAVANRIRQFDQNNIVAWKAIALYHFERREFRPALAALDQVNWQTRNDDTVWTLRGGILRNQYAFTHNKWELDQAIAAFDQALLLSPGDYAATQARLEVLAVRRRANPLWSSSTAQLLYWGGWVLLCAAFVLTGTGGSSGGQNPAVILIGVIAGAAILGGWILALIGYAQTGRWGRFTFFLLFGLWLAPVVIISWITLWFFGGMARALSS